jgi:hypothetical protein
MERHDPDGLAECTKGVSMSVGRTLDRTGPRIQDTHDRSPAGSGAHTRARTRPLDPTTTVIQ